ncbi:hypothetical protein SLS54_001588 [Diplodia seriata]
MIASLTTGSKALFAAWFTYITLIWTLKGQVLGYYNRLTNDIGLVLIPANVLWSAKIPLRRKLLVALLLSSSFFIIACALLRGILGLQSINNIVISIQWGTRETFVTIIVICVPPIKPLFSPSKSSSQGGSSQGHYGTGTGTGNMVGGGSKGPAGKAIPLQETSMVAVERDLERCGSSSVRDDSDMQSLGSSKDLIEDREASKAFASAPAERGVGGGISVTTELSVSNSRSNGGPRQGKTRAASSSIVPTKNFIDTISGYIDLSTCAEGVLSTVVRAQQSGCGDNEASTSYTCFCTDSSSYYSHMISSEVADSCGASSASAQASSAIAVFDGYCALGVEHGLSTTSSAQATSGTRTASPAAGATTAAASQTSTLVTSTRSAASASATATSASSSSDSDSTRTTAIAAGVAVPVGVIGLALVGYLFYRKRLQSARGQHDMNSPSVEMSAPLPEKRYPPQELPPHSVQELPIQSSELHELDGNMSHLIPGLTYALSVLSCLPTAKADYVYNGDYVTYCGQYDALNTTSGLYDIINNAWGDDGSGLTCTTVHSYPDALFNTELFPLAFPDLISLKLGADWAIIPAPSDDSATNEATLASLDVVADVAIDLFLDEDASTASDASAAAYEVMIWQAAYGNCDPIGYDPTSTSAPTQELGGVTYTLFQGPNGSGQTVFTWYPDRNLSSIDVDYFPLLEALRGGSYIPTAAYLGRFQWGSETKHSAQNQNMTFVVNSLAMSVN